MFYDKNLQLLKCAVKRKTVHDFTFKFVLLWQKPQFIISSTLVMKCSRNEKEEVKLPS